AKGRAREHAERASRSGHHRTTGTNPGTSRLQKDENPAICRALASTATGIRTPTPCSGGPALPKRFYTTAPSCDSGQAAILGPSPEIVKSGVFAGPFVLRRGRDSNPRWSLIPILA